MLFSQPVPRDTGAPKPGWDHIPLTSQDAAAQQPQHSPLPAQVHRTQGRTLGKGKKIPSAQSAHSALWERIKIAGRRAGPEYQAAFSPKSTSPSLCSPAGCTLPEFAIPHKHRQWGFSSGELQTGTSTIIALATPQQALERAPDFQSRQDRLGGGFSEYSTPLHSRPAYY